jgi:hypothetical protein
MQKFTKKVELMLSALITKRKHGEWRSGKKLLEVEGKFRSLIVMMA